MSTTPSVTFWRVHLLLMLVKLRLLCFAHLLLKVPCQTRLLGNGNTLIGTMDLLEKYLFVNSFDQVDLTGVLSVSLLLEIVDAFHHLCIAN